MLIPLRRPLPVGPRPCGVDADDRLVQAWHADTGRGPGEALGGPGVCTTATLTAGDVMAAMTLELWVAWPDGRPPLRAPAVLAEAAGEAWTWQLGFDHAGSLAFHWRAGDETRSAATDILIDALQPATWYHVGLELADGDRVGLAVTPAGEPLARVERSFHQLDLGKIPHAAPDSTATLSLGRGHDDPTRSPIHIGSAALHRVLRGPADFPALGAPPPPAPIRIDSDIDFGTLGRAVAVDEDLIVYSAGERGGDWVAFRVRGAKGRTLRFLHWPVGPMGLAVHLSDDGGRTWGRPNGGVWRQWGESPFEARLLFTHRFDSDEAIVATSPPVTAAMADAWLDDAAARLGGRIHAIGRSREGRPLRVLEVGNPEAPAIYLHAGQHSMLERLGFYLITAAVEAAAADAELMASTRWLILPVVNVDSYTVGGADGNMNRAWDRPDPPPTVRAIADFLTREFGRTGGRVVLDLHAGPVFRGHFILVEGPGGRHWPDMNIHVKRESCYEDFEACLRAEGIDYTVMNSYTRNPQVPGLFEDFAAALPGVTAPLCIEISPIVADTPDGVVPTTPDALRADGVRWCRAIKRYLNL